MMDTNEPNPHIVDNPDELDISAVMLASFRITEGLMDQDTGQMLSTRKDTEAFNETLGAELLASGVPAERVESVIKVGGIMAREDAMRRAGYAPANAHDASMVVNGIGRRIRFGKRKRDDAHS
jgi:hypothetical protein